MKFVNQNTNAILVLVAAIVIATSVPAKAEETGFTLEDSIRNQIFLELKSNVQNLYRSGNLLVPGVEISVAERVAANDSNSGFTLPLSTNGSATRAERPVNNIN